MKHPAYENLQRYYKGEITLEELMALNSKLVINKIDIPIIISKAKEIFTGPSERGCPADKTDEERIPF